MSNSFGKVLNIRLHSGQDIPIWAPGMLPALISRFLLVSADFLN
jgi:hypothetical protein